MTPFEMVKEFHEPAQASRTEPVRCLNERHPGAEPWFLVIVHDSVDSLRKAATRSSPNDPNGFADSVGVFHPAPIRERYDKAAGKWRPVDWYMGSVRFSRGHLSSEVLAHEATHAAAHLYRRLWNKQGYIGDHCGDDEEAFAYLVGASLSVINDALHDMDAWGGGGG